MCGPIVCAIERIDHDALPSASAPVRDKDNAVVGERKRGPELEAGSGSLWRCTRPPECKSGSVSSSTRTLFRGTFARQGRVPDAVAGYQLS